MTQQEVHEIFTKASDEEKMHLAIGCQMNGIHPIQLETTLANVVTGIQKSLMPAINYYKYLEGKYSQDLHFI